MPAAARIVTSRQALLDLEEAVDHYIREASDDVALGFVGAVENAVDALRRQPRIGSPRLGHELQIANLRSWPVAGFPYLVFYIEQENAVFVVRVLHGARDIPKSLADPDTR